jgi:hypothetical protein
MIVSTMKRNLLLVVAVVLITIGLFLLVQTFRNLNPPAQGGLQVVSNIKASVYLNDVNLGQTPICKCDQNNTVPSGEHTVKIVPADSQYTPFVAKIKVEPGLLTVVDRTFLPGALASAYILTLEKIKTKEAQLFVGSLPDSAVVTVDSVPRGATPYTLDSISESEHEIEVEKEGFAKKTMKVNTLPEHRLTVFVYMGTDNEEITADLQKVSPTPALSITPTGAEKQAANEVTIDETPVGFLRVRSTPSTAGTEVGRVNPGETFEYSQTQNGWYKITLSDGEEGWVSGEYVSED